MSVDAAAESLFPQRPRVAAVVLAAGRGSRAAADGGPPKQHRLIGERSVLARSLAPFLAAPRVDVVAVVTRAEDLAAVGEALAGAAEAARLLVVAGGERRQDSVLRGLEALSGAAPEVVLIHDAARCFVSPAVVERAIDAALAHGAAVPATPVVDTIVEAADDGSRGAQLDRARLRAVQTPQAFRFALIHAAHRAVAGSGAEFTDDGAVAMAAGHPVAIFPGESANVKLTTPDDILAAQRRHALEDLARLGDIRTGTGFDVHAFVEGDHVVLGGVRIPHGQALSGHSDADVALHALTDALYGAIGDGDIGSHFPPSDARWRGADSAIFLAAAAAAVRERGGAIAHLDVTIVCEAPKVGPHREAMRARIAAVAGIDLARVAVKATTSERLGFTGRREGIAAMASATVRLPYEGGLR